MLGNQTLRCASGVDAGDTCLSDAQIAGYDLTNTAWTLNYTLASGGRRTRASTPGAQTLATPAPARCNRLCPRCL